MLKRYSVAIAGSTQNTRLCAQSLIADERFAVTSVITPVPKVSGREQQLNQNPVHTLATEKNIPVILIEKKIDTAIQEKIKKLSQPDFLLVVDFGYIVPTWLLEWPKTAPLNIHPSLLPRWRGSSPGQFVLLYGEKESAVTLMVMDAQLDHGPLIAQISLYVQEKWTQTEYYAESFRIICEQLPELLVKFAEGTLVATPQPDATPTPIAGRFQREDGFVSWEVVKQAMSDTTNQQQSEANAGEQPAATPQPAAASKPVAPLSPILTQALGHHHSLAKTLYHATFALQPWPGLWTIIATSAGEKRMKIVDATLENDKLTLRTIHIEGKKPTSWNEVKNTL